MGRPAEERLDALERAIRGGAEGLVGSINRTHGELSLETSPANLVELLIFLRDDDACQLRTLVDICAVDHLGETPRFAVVYHLLGMTKNHRVRVRVRLDEGQTAPSAICVFPAASWYEREAFDMYGLVFSDHPDLRRLLTDYGFDGYPLRKDFPLSGRVQVRYDEGEKRVVSEPVKLVQEYRNFDFVSPWEGMQAGLPGDEKADATEAADG